MIPVKLSLKGLYSYREKQEIDFDTLMAAQLFGVFGEVGSGKSSILEAMMFILFDQSDRLNAKDNRYYNMLNLQSNEMEIDFVFRAGEQSRQKYRFYFLAKRKKSDFEKVEVKDRSYYQWKNDEWFPLPEQENAASILGMSFHNFMQTIIIPQGKFREFIDLTPTYRTRMLKELFHLEKFDLAQKTNTLIGKCKSEIDRLEGELKGMGEVSKEDIKTLQKEIAANAEKLKKNEAGLISLEKENNQLEQLKSLFEKLVEARTQLAGLQDQKPDFDAREKRLARYEKAERIFKAKLVTFDDTLEQSKTKNKRIQETEQEIQKKEVALKAAEKHMTEAKKAYDGREKIRQQCDELGILIEIKKLQANWEKTQQNATKAEVEFQKLKKQKETRSKEIQEKEQQRTTLEDKIPDTKILYELSHWHKAKRENLAEQEKTKKEYKTQQEEKQKILAVCRQLTEDYTFLPDEFSFETVYQKMAEEEKRLKLEEEKALKSLQNLQVKQKLSAYASELQEGEPCPLCGATHHPQIAHTDSASETVQQEEQNLKTIRGEISQLGELEKKAGKLEHEVNLKNILLEKAEAEKQRVDNKLSQHQNAFVWKIFEGKTAEEIDSLIKEAEQQEGLLKKLRDSIKTLRSAEIAQEKLYEQTQKQRDEAQKHAHEIEVTIRTKKSALKLMPFDKFEKYSMEQLGQSLKNGESKYESVKTAYDNAVEAVNKLNLDVKGLKTQKEADEKQLEELVGKSEKLIKEIRDLCTEHDFSGPDEVRQILQQNLNTEAERKKIEEYKEKLHSLQGNFQQLRKDTEDKNYNEQYHREQAYQLKTLKDEVGVQKENLALQRKQVTDLTEKLEKREKLDKDLSQLNHRLENLKEMSGLFRGSGFVNYASHIYLNDLCKAANERFMQLTRNNLSLELNENNDFIVRDFLNDGKTRLLKTLSGGQTFQAALCLALALAENVKSLNQAGQSFFFLDEGFGALDKTSLRIVFDTLKSLQKEHRVVGVISHVEALQQEIDVFLTVKNDRERGSVIQYSWG